MDNSIKKFQCKFKYLLSRRFKFSLFITIVKLARHISTSHHCRNVIHQISLDYIKLAYDTIDKTSYNNIWTQLEALRLNYGGYYSELFLHFSHIHVADDFKMWEYFMHSCFVVTKYKLSNARDLIPIFDTNNITFDDKLNVIIEVSWRGHLLEGFFHTDHLHFFSYCPLTLGNTNTLLKMMNKDQQCWFRGDIAPYFTNVKSMTILLESYSKLFALYNEFVSKSISTTATDFTECSLYEKYFLIYIFSKGDDKKIFIAMLLYTIICKDSEVDANTMLNKLPIHTRNILTKRLNLTEEKLAQVKGEYDEQSYEIKICALQAPDRVKKIAIEKLREIQSKPIDIVKPQLFLEKLLEIPFEVYKIEPCFKMLKIFLMKIQLFVRDTESTTILYPSSWVELESFFDTDNELSIFMALSNNRNSIISIIKSLQKSLEVKTLKYTKNNTTHVVKKSKSNIEERYIELKEYMKNVDFETKRTLTNIINVNLSSQYSDLSEEWIQIKNKIQETQAYVSCTLQKSLYGQNTAKRAIEQIICEWITGDIKGYCFGFSGPPGVGKTTLAKEGLSRCLIDDDGTSRPFEIIALGGSSQGSSLEGHGYTYASSTCGKIVNTLIRSCCMNPIIFFDELDKVSKTPQGQEIINILIHLTDPSQNTAFHDKYFDGVDINLSKVLFVFSYNDESLVDPILLDRIHKIQFQSFSTKEKAKICFDFILPQLFQKIGINQSSIIISDALIENLIETYTVESGVRMIRQILSSMLREVNILILNGKQKIPIELEIGFVKSVLLRDYTPSRHKRIYNAPHQGTAVGLFALSSGGGGILHIEIRRSQGKNSIEMTGNLGNIMKESVKVALTAVYNILRVDAVEENILDKSLHIHATDGSVPKDGPSAGVAIALAILSCILDTPLINYIAFTGEIDLNGNITAVGGIPDKLRGAFLAGIKTVFCPSENKIDVEKIDRKQNDWMDDITIFYVSTISDSDLITMSFTNDVIHKLTNIRRSRSITF